MNLTLELLPRFLNHAVQLRLLHGGLLASLFLRAVRLNQLLRLLELRLERLDVRLQRRRHLVVFRLLLQLRRQRLPQLLRNLVRAVEVQLFDVIRRGHGRHLGRQMRNQFAQRRRALFALRRVRLPDLH